MFILKFNLILHMFLAFLTSYFLGINLWIEWHVLFFQCIWKWIAKPPGKIVPIYTPTSCVWQDWFSNAFIANHLELTFHLISNWCNENGILLFNFFGCGLCKLLKGTWTSGFIKKCTLGTLTYENSNFKKYKLWQILLWSSIWTWLICIMIFRTNSKGKTK